MDTSLGTWQGCYLSAQPGGRLEANRTHEAPWEIFAIEQQADGSIAFRGAHDLYICAEAPETGYAVTCSRPHVGPWECWRPEKIRDGVYAFKSAHGAYLTVELDQTVRADRTEVGEWEQFAVTVPSGGEVPSAVAIVGTLTASYSGGTADDHGPRLVVACHAGDLLARAVYDKPAVEGFLDEIAAADYPLIRIWTVLYGGWWAARTGEVHPGQATYWGDVQWLAEQLARRRLRWLVSQGDLMRWATTTAARRDYLQRLALELRPTGVAAAVDAANEGGNNGEGDKYALKAALDAFTDVLPLPVRSLTSAPSEAQMNEYLTTGVLRDLHSTRAAWPKSGRYVFNTGYDPVDGLRVYTVQSEGPGYGCQEYAGDNRVGHHVSSTQNPAEWNDNDPEIGLTLAALHIIGKALYVWFSSPGVISDEPFSNYGAFRAVPKLYAMFPRNVQTWRTFHGGEGRAFSGDRVLAVPASGAEVRCDHAANGAERICVAYGVSGAHTMRVVNDFEGVLIHPGTLEQTAVRWQRDQMVTLEFRRGRILIGRIH